jgi:hypothetical protein
LLIVSNFNLPLNDKSHASEGDLTTLETPPIQVHPKDEHSTNNSIPAQYLFLRVHDTHVSRHLY